MMACPLTATLPRSAAVRYSPIPRGQSVDQRSLIMELLAHGGELAAETGVIGDQRAGRLQRTLLVYHLLPQVGDLLILLC